MRPHSFLFFQRVGKSQRIELPWQQGGQRFESSPSPLFLKHGWQSGRMHRFCNPVFHIVGSNPMPCAILLNFMPVLNSIGRVAAQYTYNEHASKLLPCWYPALWGLRFSVVTYSECVHWSLILGLYYLGASPRGRGRSAVNRLQLKTHRRFKSFRARHFKVGNMSRDKTEYQISKIGHVQHSRLVLRHAIQMILYGRIIDYY